MQHGEVERRLGGSISVEARAKGKPKIVGYAAVFNEMSEDLGGFREEIKPGAFDRALREAHDVRALIDHVPSLILGRTKADTLALSVDAHGLRMEITPPDTQPARDLLQSISRGDISGASFGFRTLTDDWRTEDGETIRELKDLELFDVSVATFPAYPNTQVSTRALEQAQTYRATGTEDAPTEPKPTQEKPTEEKPTEEKPTEEKPAEEKEPPEEEIVYLGDGAVAMDVNEAKQLTAGW
jgi:Escherichia/Staphylococcus phage prohead protease